MGEKFYNLIGIWVNALTIPKLNALIADSITRNQHWIIANHNLHSIYLYHHDAKMHAFYAKADYIHVDGMALVLLGRLLGLPLKREHRVTYADWIIPLIKEAQERGWRLFYLGSEPGVAERGARILKEKFPNLQIATSHGYFDARPEAPENQAVLEVINAYQPHILMVGMSMPRQEHWVLDNLDRICANAILTAGAAIDYVAGATPTPPRWAGRLGLEWLFRLIAEPKRLWRRYLIEPWFLFRLFLAEGFNKVLTG
ncbi:MAG: N-acetylglucosaminyldiphosphoundecaprenol N-acetyl-beta-D-mannosaminyltransferase [Chroococcidiopsis cubana SAG 39.79]|uniref:Glycosyl transferase n=1 Tax=Chroococcidiopsis cubana SAG 39.79 TaxID=388085 RepID=A0AB37UCK0_9CYAN|nr:WecB/TagA/CpsF family glycosyltransferase [Chroococcidiopsis cubana]MDZ4871527.1 N-acetylglucosaminyldiphosphoundecaprenol N-acetyl-beta-D-mannosaminyltransferase [Chroococcidiopsis cubana SAG 39.79]PSB64740.1 glycosyltransferase [Chroococcidiopsis cubana CCALA 043]RUT04173.1 glycosyl transferase [Chroococcidiopsis cubana SAG 39.79]